MAQHVTKTRVQAPSDKCQPQKSELGQIDHVIGDFGWYQFLIFIFKILIGVTSAFNNLGVTFFAPTDFVGHWCSNNTTTAALSNHSSLSSSSLGNSTGQLIIQDSLFDASQRSTSYADASPLTPRRSVDYQQVLTTFVVSEERKSKHYDMNYDTPKSIRKECKYVSPSDKSQSHKCTSYQYDKGIWLSTIIDEWDLVCDRGWLISLTQSLYMSGFIISFLVFGYISDRFGRWRSLMLGALIEVSSGFGCAFANSITTFMIFRFLVGLGNAGRSSSSYLIMIEWCGPRWRMHISTLGSLGWIIGYCSMPWITLHYLHFRHMQLFTCFYELIFIIWLLRIPESPRWLLTHRRFDEAYKILLMAAKFNGLIQEDSDASGVNGQNNGVVCKSIHMIRDGDTASMKNDIGMVNSSSYDSVSSRANILNLSTTTATNTHAKQQSIPIDPSETSNHNTGSCQQDLSLKPYTLEEFDVKFQHLVRTIESKEFTKNEDRLSIIDLMKWKNLRRYSLILFFAWAANSFIYYGIVLRVGSFGGSNLFVTFTIAGITELPSIAFTILAMKFLPRGTTNVFMFATVGLLCAIQAPLKYYDYQWLQQSTIILAKLFNTCSFTCILYQTMELFPTSIRQTAYSSCSLAGRVGSILAPFVKELASMTNEFVPPAMYAALSFLEVILIKRLPETKGSDLTDTLLEAEKFKGTDKINEPNLATSKQMETSLSAVRVPIPKNATTKMTRRDV